MNTRLNNLNRIFVITLSFLLIYTAGYLNAQTPDRSKPPEPGKPESLNLPEIKHLKLSNGIPVVYMKKSQVPLVQVNVLLKIGRVNDPEDMSGLADLTTDMLDEGTAKFGPLELADQIDYLGARISTSSGFHSTRIALHTPKSRLDSALYLLSDIVKNPSFPEKELERLRKERLTALMQRHDNPNIIASVLFNSVIFGKNHPYGRTSIGDENFIRNVKIADIKKFYNSNFNAGTAAIIVVGDIEENEIKGKLEKVFGEWKKGEAPALKLSGVDQQGKTKIYIVDKPGAVQSVINIGHVGVQRNTEDYYSLLVMNTILGGSFTSRLNQNLREEHGYTYGAGSNFGFRLQPGPFSAGASVQTEVSDSALIEFMKELKGISQPVNDEELEGAKNYIALQFPYEFETVENVAGMLEDLVIYNLPEDYFNDYVNNIMLVKKQDVEKAAKKYVRPDASSIIIVGDKQKISESIQKLGFGEITFLTIEDVLGKLPILQ